MAFVCHWFPGWKCRSFNLSPPWWVQLIHYFFLSFFPNFQGRCTLFLEKTLFWKFSSILTLFWKFPRHFVTILMTCVSLSHHQVPFAESDWNRSTPYPFNATYHFTFNLLALNCFARDKKRNYQTKTYLKISFLTRQNLVAYKLKQNKKKSFRTSVIALNFTKKNVINFSKNWLDHY